MIRPLPALLVLAGCALTPRPPPPLQTVELEGRRATYRRYGLAGANVCEAEPRWLFDELTSVNGVLDRFLERAGDQSVPLHRQGALLEEANETIPGLVEDHARNLEALERCAFAGRGGFPKIRERGQALVAEARGVLDAAPARLARLKAIAAREAWLRNLPRAEVSARLGCDDKSRAKRNAEPFFAYEDETGTTRWLFCDGTRVVGEAGGELTVLEPAGLSRLARRRFKAAPYEAAARELPKERISRPPPLPSDAPQGATSKSTRSASADG